MLSKNLSRIIAYDYYIFTLHSLKYSLNAFIKLFQTIWNKWLESNISINKSDTKKIAWLNSVIIVKMKPFRSYFFPKFSIKLKIVRNEWYTEEQYVIQNSAVEKSNGNMQAVLLSKQKNIMVSQKGGK